MDGSFQTLETATEHHSRAHRRSQSKDHSSFFELPVADGAAGNLATQRLFRSGALRARLAINQPGDSYEQEADRVADHVIRTPEPGVQRTCAACATGATPCPKCEVEKVLQRKTEAQPIKMSAPDSFVQSLGSGQPLD